MSLSLHKNNLPEFVPRNDVPTYHVSCFNEATQLQHTHMLRKSLIFSAVILLLCSAIALAQEPAKKSASKPQTLVGFLTDVQCGESFESDKMAAGHTKECCLMPACAASGFGLYTKKKLIKFDAAGSEKAKAYLQATKREKNLKVKVKGEMQGDVFAVVSIEDAK
jgi:hypothetical protein